jgi:aspartate aminotransferase
MASPLSDASVQHRLSRRLQALPPSPTIAVDTKAKALVRQGVDVLALTVGEPDFDTPDHIKAAAERAIRDGKTKYTPAGGVPELREAICEKFARENGLRYEPAETVACVGGKQVLYNIMLAILDPGDEVIVPTPNWPTFADQVALADGKAVLVKTGPGYKLRRQDVEPYVTNRTRALILNSPSNPTGAVMDRSEIQAITELAIERRFYIVSDETYEHFLYGDAKHVAPASLSPEAREWTIEVNTVSKTYAMTGWRVGYAAGPREIIKAIDSIMSQTTSNPSSIAQWAAIAALTGSQDSVGTMVTEFARRRRRFIEGLHKLGWACEWPEGAFYAYPLVPGGTPGNPADSTTFANRLLDEARVAVVPGVAFFDEGTLRMSYAASVEVLDKVLERLERMD